MRTIGSCLRGKKETCNNKKIVKFKYKYSFSQYIYVRYFVINIMKEKIKWSILLEVCIGTPTTFHMV